MKKDLKTLLPVILEAIEQDGGKVRIYPHGKSMLPMIREGVDSVVLVKPDNVRLYDVVFYKNSDGYALHRVVKICKDGFCVCGDNQSVSEKISKCDIIAKVESWYRENDHIFPDDTEYKRYISKIVFIRPFRRIKRKLQRNNAGIKP